MFDMGRSDHFPTLLTGQVFDRYRNHILRDWMCVRQRYVGRGCQFSLAQPCLFDQRNCGTTLHFQNSRECPVAHRYPNQQRPV